MHFPIRTLLAILRSSMRLRREEQVSSSGLYGKVTYNGQLTFFSFPVLFDPLFHILYVLTMMRLYPLTLMSRWLFSAVFICLGFWFFVHHCSLCSAGSLGALPTPTSSRSCTPLIASNPAVTITTTSTTPPLPSATGIPEKLWYKLGPKGLSEDSRKFIEDCLTKNPTYRFEFMTDDTSDLYVKRNFAHRPDIVETYLNIPIPILRADILRYLILYNEGGIWNDLDISCEDTTINEWIPEKYMKKLSLVVGLEFDWAWEDDNFLHSQFASWTMMAKPKSPHMLNVVDDILVMLAQQCSDHGVKLQDIKKEMLPDIVDVTGPKMMTRSIVKGLELMLHETIDDRYSNSPYPFYFDFKR